MQLTDEEKKLITEHVKELSEKNEGVLRELNFYRWALRTFFVLLFGGSLLGILKLQDYLDDRIQKRSEELSGIIYGVAAQASGDASAAVEQYAQFLDKLDNPLFRPADSIRAIYYNRFLSSLGDDTQLDASGDFLVSPIYYALLDSKTYKKDLFSNQRRWQQEQFMLNALARCIIKFENSKERMAQAADFYRRAVSLAERPVDKATNHFALALFALSVNNMPMARQNLMLASDISPRTHGIQSFIGTYKDDLGTEYQVWDRLARIYNQPGVEQRFESLIKELKEKDAKRH